MRPVIGATRQVLGANVFAAAGASRFVFGTSATVIVACTTAALTKALHLDLNGARAIGHPARAQQNPARPREIYCNRK